MLCAYATEGHQAPTRVRDQGHTQTHVVYVLWVSQDKILTHTPLVWMKQASLDSSVTQHRSKAILWRWITFPSYGGMHNSTTLQYPELDFPEIPIRMSSLEIMNYKEFMPSWLRLAAQISIFSKFFWDTTVSSVFATVISVIFLPYL